MPEILTNMTYKTNNSQCGWTIIENHRDEAGLYLIEDERGNRYHVPCIIWDSLKGAKEKSEEYRKSRNYFKEARDSEKKACSEIHVKLVENHSRVVQDLYNEINYYQNEINDMEGQVRNYKAMALCAGVMFVASFLYIFII